MKKHIDLDLLKRFCIVAEQRSITKAAQILQVTQPALSRSLQSLEESIGERLFIRISTGMELNPKGQQLWAYAQGVLIKLSQFEHIFFDDENQVAGDLKISVFPYVGAEMIVPKLSEFMERYPVKITLDSNSSSNPKDMLPIMHDVSIGLFIAEHEDLIQKKLLTFHTKLFASPQYLQERGQPQSMKDLKNHDIIYHNKHGYFNVMGGSILDDLSLNHVIETDSIRGVVNAALSGQGICELPNFSTILNSGLYPVLPNEHGANIDLFYIFNKNRSKSMKINLFYEYLENVLTK